MAFICHLSDLFSHLLNRLAIRCLIWHEAHVVRGRRVGVRMEEKRSIRENRSRPHIIALAEPPDEVLRVELRIKTLCPIE